MTHGERCPAVLRYGSEVVRCERLPGHDGTHAGSADGSSCTWSEPDVEGAFHLGSFRPSSEDDRAASYAAIEVEHCIYCRSDDPEVAFVFVQPRGLRVAVPGRIGLCAVCHRLLRGGDFSGLLERTRGTDFEAFPDDAVLELIRASGAALPA